MAEGRTRAQRQSETSSETSRSSATSSTTTAANNDTTDNWDDDGFVVPTLVDVAVVHHEATAAIANDDDDWFVEEKPAHTAKAPAGPSKRDGSTAQARSLYTPAGQKKPRCVECTRPLAEESKGHLCARCCANK
jgi:hypothetical protein